MIENSQKSRVDDIEELLNNILNTKESFLTTIYSSSSSNKTYQKILLTDNITDYIQEYKQNYWINHDPAALGLCLFNFEGGD